jgi:plasmid maintenance system antidote protein VapI
VQNCHKKTVKAKNARMHMCGHMLRWIRLQMKFDPRDMCATLDLKRRTYQDYEAGKRNIPAKLAARIREMYQRDREFMSSIPYSVDAAWERGNR